MKRLGAAKLSDFRPLKNGFRKCSFLVFSQRQLQSSPKILETPMHFPFPLQCWHVIATFHGYKNIAKVRGKRRGSESFQFFKVFVCQSGSRFLSETVAIRQKQYCAIDQNKDFMLGEPHWSLYPDAGSLFFTFREILPSYWNSISRTIRSSTS